MRVCFSGNHMTNLTSRNWNQPLYPTLVASATKWLIHLLLLEAPISAQATTYRMKLTSVDGGNLFNRKMLVGSLGVGPWDIFGKILLEGRHVLLHTYMLWWYGLEKLPISHLFSRICIYIYIIISIFRDHPSSEHTIFHIIKALPQLPWDPETQTTHHPDGRTSLFSQQLEAGRAQLWVMAVKIPPRNWWCQWGVKIHLLLGKTWVYRSNTD